MRVLCDEEVVVMNTISYIVGMNHRLYTPHEGIRRH